MKFVTDIYAPQRMKTPWLLTEQLQWVRILILIFNTLVYGQLLTYLLTNLLDTSDSQISLFLTKYTFI